MIGAHFNFSPPTRRRILLTATFGAALLLSIMPVPPWAEPFRPDWVALVLIYWCLALPDRVGIGTGWTVGLILDVLYGSLLGQHALAKALLAFLTLKLHLQIRMFPRWQQAVTVFVLVGLNNLLVLWIRTVTGHGSAGWAYWMPSVMSMLIWPWVFVVLRDARRRNKIS
jgi:rod shape-determining protein MreD